METESTRERLNKFLKAKKETKEALDFDKKHQEIIAKYQGEMPILEHKPRVILVVPSLAELSNDNFWRLLRSLALQEKVNQNDCVTLIVVNNSRRAAEINRLEQENISTQDIKGVSNYEGFEPTLLVNRYQENQTHLAILQKLTETRERLKNTVDTKDKAKAIEFAVQNIANSVPLTEHEQEICRLALQRGVNIFGIDCNSENKAIERTDTENNPIGIARNIGGHIACELFHRSSKPNGLIDFIDGDCFISPDYFAREVDLLPKFIGHFVVKPVVLQTVDIPKTVEAQSDKQKRLAALITYLTSSLRKRCSYQEYSVAGSSSLGGMAVAVSPSLFRQVGGYPTFGGSEDFAFGRKLHTVDANPYFLSGAEVFLSDRGRQGSTDGSSRGSLHSHENDVRKLVDDARFEANSEKNHELRNLLESNSAAERSKSRREYVRLRHHFFHRESLKRRVFVQTVDEIIPVICQTYQQLNQPANSTEAILSVLKTRINKRAWDFLSYNSVLVETVTTIYDIVTARGDIVGSLGIGPHASPPDKIKSFLEKYLPEYFALPPKDEPEYHLTESQREDINLRDYIHIIDARYALVAGRRAKQIK